MLPYLELLLRTAFHLLLLDALLVAKVGAIEELEAELFVHRAHLPQRFLKGKRSSQQNATVLASPPIVLTSKGSVL